MLKSDSLTPSLRLYTAGVVDRLVAGGDVEIIGVNAPIDHCGSGEDVGVVGAVFGTTETGSGHSMLESDSLTRIFA
jgi:hypothetical protein